MGLYPFLANSFSNNHPRLPTEHSAGGAKYLEIYHIDFSTSEYHALLLLVHLRYFIYSRNHFDIVHS